MALMVERLLSLLAAGLGADDDYDAVFIAVVAGRTGGGCTGAGEGGEQKEGKEGELAAHQGPLGEL